jgi:hypothetical protein
MQLGCITLNDGYERCGILSSYHPTVHRVCDVHAELGGIDLDTSRSADAFARSIDQRFLSIAKSRAAVAQGQPHREFWLKPNHAHGHLEVAIVRRESEAIAGKLASIEPRLHGGIERLIARKL